jgi:tRNA threonylcarbamoyl adenosine modification protein YeaZ
MTILALEFSSIQRSVAVLSGTGILPVPVGIRAGNVSITGQVVRPDPLESCPAFEVIETSRGKTMRPLGMIEEVLRQAGVEREAIGCIVVGLGPGSYTGIRAAIALAQGWQLAREVKLAGVSSAEGIAAQAQAEGLRGRVNAVVDAQRGEFYLATWELADQARRETESLRIVRREVVEARVQAGECVIGPEVTAWFPTGRQVFPRALRLAEIAKAGVDPVPGERLEPIYLRETAFVKAPPPRIVS